MNKKFSTLLTASLLMVGALFSSANAAGVDIPYGDKATSVSSGSMYYVVLQASDGLAANDVMMGMKNADGTLAGLASKAAGSGTFTFTGAAGAEVTNYLWTVSETTENNKKFYTLKNVKAEAYLASNSENSFAFVSEKDNATGDKSVIKFTFGKDGDAYSSTYLLPNGGTEADNALVVADNGTISFNGDGSSAKKVILYSVKPQSVTAETLNAAFGGAGFSFAPDGVEVEDNIFDQSIKAFDVADDIELEAGVRAIKAGTYFATSYPDELADANAINQAAVEAGYFDACTFIAVSPTENFKTSKLPQSNGEGFKFTTVKGEDLNTYIAGDNLSSKEEVSIFNAAFIVQNLTSSLLQVNTKWL